jgi:hypothetical protein
MINIVKDMINIVKDTDQRRRLNMKTGGQIRN